jgi:amidase
VYLLDAIVGFDPRDCEATKEASEFIPADGYKKFLKKDGLKGKRLGIVRNPFEIYFKDPVIVSTFDHHLEVLRYVLNTSRDRSYKLGHNHTHQC